MQKAHQRSREERIELSERAWRMAVAGRTQAEIAAKLGVHQGQVSRWLARARRIATERLADAMTSWLLVSYKQTERIIREANLAFERSTKPLRRVIRRNGVVTTIVEERDGNPAWLHVASETMRLRMVMFGDFLPRLERARGDAKTPGQEDAISGEALLEALREAERRDAEYRARQSAGSVVSD